MAGTSGGGYISRENKDFILLASAARTAATDSTDQTNINARGVTIIIKTTAETSTAIITPNVLIKDVITGDDVIIWTAAATITTLTTSSYQLYPGILAADFDGTEAVNIVLPRTWVFRMTVANANSMTYSVAASYTI